MSFEREPDHSGDQRSLVLLVFLIGIPIVGAGGVLSLALLQVYLAS